MARIRTIKPDFGSDEDLSVCSPESHLLAAMLLCHADDEGYFRANPGLVKGHCLPLREDSLSVHEMLSELSCAGFIRLGTGEDGKRYGYIPGFLRHQRINRPSPSKISELSIAWDSFTEGSLSAHGTITDHSPPEGNGMEGNREGNGTPSRAPARDGRAEDSAPPLIELPLNDGSTYGITDGQWKEWTELYPAVDVMAELRKMRGWLDANAERRKTRRGIKRFAANWLSRAQDRGGSPGQIGKSAEPRGRDAAQAWLNSMQGEDDGR